MQAVLQRVTHGSVSVNDEIVGSVGQGFVILVGVGHDDGESKERLSVAAAVQWEDVFVV